MAAEPPANPPVSVTAYRWRGDTVYYIPPTCCDAYGTLYDEGGNIACHPDGGITGEGDGRCPEFSSQAERLRVIWSDTREPDGR
jgi:hypothetical protein